MDWNAATLVKEGVEGSTFKMAVIFNPYVSVKWSEDRSAIVIRAHRSRTKRSHGSFVSKKTRNV